MEMDRSSAKINGAVPSGAILVDGYGVGDVGNIVLRDRKHLAEDGIIVVVVTLAGKTGEIVSGPDVISRGFVYVRESEDLMENVKKVVINALAGAGKKNTAGKKVVDWSNMKNAIKNNLGDYLYDNTKRKPMILPIIMEV